VVRAAFFNFDPAMVARAVPACWATVAPATLCRVRAIAAAEALGELCRTEKPETLGVPGPLRRERTQPALRGRGLTGAQCHVCSVQEHA